MSVGEERRPADIGQGVIVRYSQKRPEVAGVTITGVSSLRERPWARAVGEAADPGQGIESMLVEIEAVAVVT